MFVALKDFTQLYCVLLVQTVRRHSRDLGVEEGTVTGSEMSAYEVRSAKCVCASTALCSEVPSLGPLVLLIKSNIRTKNIIEH